jgi:fermentation-respiration switch protein FrsA (DUF1100 family)
MQADITSVPEQPSRPIPSPTLGRRRLLALGTLGAGALVAGCTPSPARSDDARPTVPADTDLGVRDGVGLRRTTFRTPDGVDLVGHLRTPGDQPGPRPTVVIPNAMTGVKEQSVQAGYAHGLARAGFTTLVFDQRGFGESGGALRQHEDNESRLADLQVAVTHLVGRPDAVDPGRIAAFGVSIGGGLALKLAAFDSRVRAFGAVAAGLLDPTRARELFTPEGYAASLTAQTEALQRFHATGEYEYIPVVRLPGVPADQPVLFDNPIALEYYGTPRGNVPQWTNRASTLSLRTILVHDTRSAAEVIGTGAGFLAVGTEDVSTFPDDHRAVYDSLTGPRSLLLVDGARHNDLYDQQPYVQQVTDAAADWFRTHLA